MFGFFKNMFSSPVEHERHCASRAAAGSTCDCGADLPLLTQTRCARCGRQKLPSAGSAASLGRPALPCHCLGFDPERHCPLCSDDLPHVPPTPTSRRCGCPRCEGCKKVLPQTLQLAREIALPLGFVECCVCSFLALVRAVRGTTGLLDGVSIASGQQGINHLIAQYAAPTTSSVIAQVPHGWHLTNLCRTGQQLGMVVGINTVAYLDLNSGKLEYKFVAYEDRVKIFCPEVSPGGKLTGFWLLGETQLVAYQFQSTLKVLCKSPIIEGQYNGDPSNHSLYQFSRCNEQLFVCGPFGFYVSPRNMVFGDFKKIELPGLTGQACQAMALAPPYGAWVQDNAQIAQIHVAELSSARIIQSFKLKGIKISNLTLLRNGQSLMVMAAAGEMHSSQFLYGFDIASGRQIFAVCYENKTMMPSKVCALSPNNQVFAIAHDELPSSKVLRCRIYLLNTQSGKLLCSFSTPGYNPSVSAMIFTEEGDLITCTDSQICRWDNLPKG